MEWISTKIRFPKAGKQVLTACKNKNMEDGIWLYDLCYYYPDSGWGNRENWEDISHIRQIMFDYNAVLKAKMCIPNDEDYCKEILRRYKENIY